MGKITRPKGPVLALTTSRKFTMSRIVDIDKKKAL
jgi:hypothetical protein